MGWHCEFLKYVNYFCTAFIILISPSTLVGSTYETPLVCSQRLPSHNRLVSFFLKICTKLGIHKSDGADFWGKFSYKPKWTKWFVIFPITWKRFIFFSKIGFFCGLFLLCENKSLAFLIFASGWWIIRVEWRHISLFGKIRPRSKIMCHFKN